jgi:DegV family protein with EDD domain
MRVVTDSGTDLCLSPEESASLDIPIVHLTITLDGRTYREGIDIEPNEFFEMLAATKSLPVTSQPSPGDFADVYRKLAVTDPDILSIHMSSGLSGTFNSARLGAAMVPEANVTLFDTKTLGATAGWQVTAAARALKAGASVEDALAQAQRIGDASETLYTLRDLTYLIHGGRISHMKGLIASVLDFKPIIRVEKTNGTYQQTGQVRSFKRVIAAIVEIVAQQHPRGAPLRVQAVHSADPTGAEMLREQVDKHFECTWLPTRQLSLGLSAHVGPSMIALGYAPEEVFAELP